MRSLLRLSLVLLPGLTLLPLAGCGSSTSSGPQATSTPGRGATTVPSRAPITAVLVTDTGGLRDRSYNQHAWQGLLKAQRADGIHPRVVQSKAEGDYLKNIEKVARRHVGLIVAVGYSMSGAVYQAARAFPSQRFALIDAAPTDSSGRPTTLPNVASAFFKEEESGYLVGVIAGLMEKNRVGRSVHNTIGFLGATHIPGVERYIAGYVAGARKVAPTVRILGEYSDTFFDQNKGKAIGLRQVGRGADVLFQVAGPTGLGYLDAARERGVYGIGVDTNQRYLGSYMITSAVKRVTVVVRDLTRYAEDGTFRGGVFRFGLRTYGATGFAKPAPPVPGSIVAQALRYEGQIARGQIVPPIIVPRV